MGLGDRFGPRALSEVPASAAPLRPGIGAGTASGAQPGLSASDPTSALPADSSLISEAPASGMGTGFGETRQPPGGTPGAAASALPLIGDLPLGKQQRILVALVIVGLLLLIVALSAGVADGRRGVEARVAVGQAQAQAERVALSALQAAAGSPSAAAVLRDSARELGAGLADLQGRVLETAPAGGAPGAEAVSLFDLGDRVARNAGVLLGHERVLVQAGEALRAIDRRSSEMLVQAQALLERRLELGAPAEELSSASQLAVMTQRIARHASTFQGLQGGGPDVVQVLGKDLVAMGQLLAATGGLASSARDPASAERVRALQQQYASMRSEAAALLDNVPVLVGARQSQQEIARDARLLSAGLQAAVVKLDGLRGFGPLHLAGVVVAVALLGVGAAGLLRLFVIEQTRRSREAEAQRAEAERQEREAKRVNDANQAAILRLMNELQAVAEGDLTKQATVTEDITGAIADSVNYTVEELRSLASQVQLVVQRVTRTTHQVELTSTELLAASTEQLREIRDTGQAVLQMAERIHEVSAQAQRSAEVARQSLQVASSGQVAVQDTIGGMNAIRDQIQETSKRIKRLGESSQEIGEITDLISGITEQTNVLALNAAIQAASAGEAGRGFSVVAEEVQRLAERSADATRQISALVRAIQTDTLDAVAAMERSTLGVVEGARLSDAAGHALNDVDRVTRELASLIERISAQALRETQAASVVAASIQHIFAVTEQTSEGTKSTAQIVRELSRTAEELRASVARFKVN